jgi:AmmeMemoRadiSam system protein B
MTATRASAHGRLRAPAAAGLYYPRDESTLRRAIDDCLSTVRAPCDLTAKALIVPHAGYRYSGPVAAHAYRALGQARHRVRRVVIVGPAHGGDLIGLAVPASDAFLTPLGAVPVDTAASLRLLARDDVEQREEAHALEHTIEVQLPFLQRMLRDFEIVPLLAGDVGEATLDGVLEEVWGGDETLIIVSSDLSHYNDYDTAVRLDQEAQRAIERLAADELAGRHACGHLPIRALLRLARRHALRATTLAVRNSGEVIGGPCRGVVGYGAFAFQ